MTEPQDMGEYEYEIYGSTVTGQLTKQDAERMNARPVGGSAPAPQQDAPDADPQAEPAPAKSTEAASKVRKLTGNK